MKKEHQEIIDRLEQGITVTNSQSGVAKEFNREEVRQHQIKTYDEKGTLPYEKYRKSLFEPITETEFDKKTELNKLKVLVEKNIANYDRWKKKNPKRLNKKDISRTFACVNFATRNVSLSIQMSLVASQDRIRSQYPKRGIVTEIKELCK